MPVRFPQSAGHKSPAHSRECFPFILFTEFQGFGKGCFKIPLDRGEKLAYNEKTQSEDREQYSTAGVRERMGGENSPKL